MHHLEAGKTYERFEGKSIAVHIPKDYLAGTVRPVMLLLDPHGDPLDAIAKYSSIADEFGYILAGSYEFKNGLSFDESNTIVRTMISDATTVLPGNGSAVTLCGFSGGAKAALAASTAIAGISNVVYCGAAFPPGSLPLSLPSLGVTGLSDMNFSEVLYFTTALDTSKNLHSMLLTHQKHEWPDTSVFKMITGWSASRHCRIQGQCDSVNIRSTAQTCMRIIENEPDAVVQDLMLHFFVSAYDGILPTEAAKDLIIRNTRSSSYREHLNAFRNELSKEAAVREQLQEAFQTQDISWWSEKINSLRDTKKNDSNQRLLGYISLGCYTLARRSIDGGDQQNAAKFLELYRLDDPGNAEWAFLWACLDEQQGNRAAAIRHLNTAIQLGLKDSGKVMNERWLSNAVQDPEVVRLMATMH